MKTKDVKTILDILVETKNSGITSGANARKIIERFIDLLLPKIKKDNPRFSEEKFFNYYHKKLNDSKEYEKL